MDSGLSWADQWDYNTPDPPPPSSSNKDDKKGKGGEKKSFGKKVLSLAWMKDILEGIIAKEGNAELNSWLGFPFCSSLSVRKLDAELYMDGYGSIMASTSDYRIMTC
ncbi:hypothetical protein OIU76_011318 [Salix suchowensis]|uniref:Uncharacterized protein n=2 Tax=Salix TaxID=40685 RepID=A0A9Q0WTR0_9ROSI|nr:hypothetical protein OIU77_014540 [Salix suchowensis]KAJ6323990.1 hypothetical protein OIU76_011318 [Salix suchowensis]KAJ6771535.1 hypothetical protein OIU74_017886 [Salix koriyanagi]